MFEFNMDTKWKNNLKDKMITFVDLYRKEYKEPIKNIQYEREQQDDYIMIITYIFKDVEITFESVEVASEKWISISVEVDSDDKSYFDNRYEFIKNTVEQIKEND